MQFEYKKAYTLIELLAVIAVLSIAFSALFVGFGSGNGAKLSSTGRTLSGLVKAARAQAVLKNTEVRLIIHNDKNDLEKYRRYVGIVYYGTDKNSDTGWIASGDGTYLPKGIYFDRKTSENLSPWPEPTTRLNFPRLTAQNGSSGADYLFYEFNDNGNASVSNACLIFRAGSMIPDAGGTAVAELQASQAQSGLVSGLIIRPGGTATIIDEPSAITVSTPTNKIE